MSEPLNDQLLAEFADAWRWADWMFKMLMDDAFEERPIPLRHQNIFYYGHLPAFAWNHVFRLTLGRRSYNPGFDELFERGIDPPDVGAPPTVQASWPSLAEITRYKSLIEADLKTLLETEPICAEGNPQLFEAVQIALEHYLMHVETFLYMQHQLPLTMKRQEAVRLLGEEPGSQPANGGNARGRTGTSGHPHSQRIRIPAGDASLGAPRDGRFGWCNEFGQLKQAVNSFLIDKFPVSNAQFLEFVESGAYDNRALWDDEAWQWLRSTGKRHPLFWAKDDDGWYFKGMFGKVALDLRWPVWVSHAEATAFARRLGGRLPTEAEFHRAAYGTEYGERPYPWGEEPPCSQHGNFGLKTLDPAPIGSFPDSASYFGVEELVGNGWEWTGTKFAALPDFQRLRTYPGYSADFFDGRHFVMKGASPVTATRLLRSSFRNWFQPHYPYVYAKFRCVYDQEAS